MTSPALELKAAPSSEPAPETGSFEEYRAGLTHAWARIIALLGVGLIPVFLILDAFTMPEELRSRFALYRLIATVALLFDYAVLLRTKPSRYSFLHGYFVTLLVGGMIVRMTCDLGGFDSSYYAGLNLVMVAVTMLLPWRAVHSAVNGLLLISLYVAANVVVGLPFHPATLINNLYFLAATLVIAVAISFTRHRLIAQEFQLRGQLKAARDALWGEMEIAKRIQTALLPPDRRMGPYSLAMAMHPAAEVGGDYYDLIETASHEHWLAVGDVSGHGVESGLVMMMTQTSLLSMVTDVPNRSPSEVFERVNAVLCENIGRLGNGRYMTLNLVRLEAGGLRIAGKHQDVLVWRAARGEVETVENQGVWIGVAKDVRGLVTDFELPLAPGDVALFFTDGLTEAMDARGQMFGQERLAEAFGRSARLDLPELRRALVEEVTRFAAQQDDDLTLVLVRKDA